MGLVLIISCSHLVNSRPYSQLSLSLSLNRQLSEGPCALLANLIGAKLLIFLAVALITNTLVAIVAARTGHRLDRRAGQTAEWRPATLGRQLDALSKSLQAIADTL